MSSRARRAGCGRRAARRAISAGVALTCLPALPGCSHEGPAQACAAGQFRVHVTLAVDRLDVSLLNQGSACRFRGSAPVFVASALHATRPSNAKADVPAGATFVQPFAADEGMTCPPASGVGRYDLDVSIEGTTVTLTDHASVRLAPEVDACMVLTPLPAYVRTSTNS